MGDWLQGRTLGGRRGDHESALGFPLETVDVQRAPQLLRAHRQLELRPGLPEAELHQAELEAELIKLNLERAERALN